jgi:hypothetical protein
MATSASSFLTPLLLSAAAAEGDAVREEGSGAMVRYDVCAVPLACRAALSSPAPDDESASERAYSDEEEAISLAK